MYCRHSMVRVIPAEVPTGSSQVRCIECGREWGHDVTGLFAPGGQSLIQE